MKADKFVSSTFSPADATDPSSLLTTRIKVSLASSKLICLDTFVGTRCSLCGMLLSDDEGDITWTALFEERPFSLMVFLLLSPSYPIFLEWWWWWLEKMATTYLECTKLGGASSFFVPVAVLSFFGLSLSKRRLRETLCRKCCQYVRTYVRRYELHTYVQTYPFSFFRNSRPLFVLRT